MTTVNEKLLKQYEQIVYKIPKNKDIFNSDFDYEISKSIDLPLLSKGFHHLIHQNKDKMEILLNFKNRKKVYTVLYEFDRYIDNYKDHLENQTIKYFDIKNNKPKILSRAFFKLWEIIYMFDLIPTKTPKFTSAHLAEGPGSFIQATIFYRDKYSGKNSKNDKYHAITLHPEDESGHVPKLEEKFINYYKKEKPQRFIQHKTYSIKMSGGSKNKHNGDLTNPKTIDLFGGNFQKDQADFITADGGFNWKNENIQEMEAFQLIFAQCVTAVKIQKKNGHFICKIFESFADTTIKLISILNSFYSEIYITKPFTSRYSNSEKYIVCKNFIYSFNDQKKKDKIKKLDKILDDLHKNKNHFVISLFKKFEQDKDLLNIITKINSKISNNQLIILNNISQYIEGDNYHGELYNNYRQKQINATDFWSNMFLNNDFNKNKKMYEEYIKNIIKKNIK
jgi:23S rRNA U2552 (ribose-2'-O)-methylase RlmE/FtsJ